MRCGVLQNRTYRNQIKDVEELRQRVEEERGSLDQRMIDSAIKEWHKRLRACVAANREHFENALRT